MSVPAGIEAPTVPHPPSIIRGALHTIRTHWDDMLPDAPRPPTAGTIGRTQSKPLPIPVHVLDVRAETLTRLASWALLVIEERQSSAALNGWDAPAMAGFLTIHADYLGEHDAGADAAAELADSARKVIGICEPRGALEFVGPCECGGDLRARPGEAATCKTCHVKVDAQATRDQLVREAEDRLLTAAELVAIAHRLWDHPVSHVRISRWVSAGDLVQHGSIARGERVMPTYRVGDVGNLLDRLTRKG